MTEDTKPKRLTEEAIVRGKSFETLIDAANNELPVISEYQFKRDVLNLLQHPFGVDFMRQYEPYVGDLSKPLKVVEDNDRDTVLFCVPAITQTPTPSIATEGGYTAADVINSLKRERELNAAGVDERMSDAIGQIVKYPDPVDTVYLPIALILQRYGKQMVSSPEDVGKETKVTKASPVVSGSSYLEDEYE